VRRPKGRTVFETLLTFALLYTAVGDALDGEWQAAVQGLCFAGLFVTCMAFSHLNDRLIAENESLRKRLILQRLGFGS